MQLRFVFVAIGCGLVAILGDGAAHAQDASGTYRVGSDRTVVQVPEWGGDCGPRPESRSAGGGRQASVSVEGSQLTFQDGRRRLRSDGCWSDNPHVRRVGASRSGNVWTVRCQTPATDYQHEEGTVTITQGDAEHIRVEETVQYSWQLRESRCRASATRTITYERVAQAPAAPDVVVAAPPPDHVAPPVNRCASPGPATRIEVLPGRRALTPGNRACFRARAMDANRCEVPLGATPVAWQLTRGAGAATPRDAVMEDACVRAPPDSPPAVYAVTATAGALSARGEARVVSAEELRSLVAAHFEDEDPDAGAPSTGTATRPGVGVGSGPSPPSAPPAPSGQAPASPVAYVLLALAAVLLVAAVVILARRRKTVPRRRDAAGDFGEMNSSMRIRRDAVPIPARELPIASGLTLPSSAVRPDAPTVPVPTPPRRMKRCPSCQKEFTHENAFCPEDGTLLVDSVEGANAPPPTGLAAPPAVAAPRAAPASVSSAGPAPICPVCHQPVEGGVPFCPNDGTPVTRDAMPLRCPTCQRRFALGTVFCGDDGTPLIPG